MVRRMSTIRAAPTGNGYRLLYVSSGEFEPRNCDSLPRGVSPAECDVRQAADGAAGLALLRAEQFDCLLLGADLPDMTAIEFLSAAAVDGAPPCMVVLVPSLRKPKPHPIAHSITSAVARLLLVDDIAMNREMIGGLLRAAGHDVALAGSGQDAGPLASQQTYDLILMDVRMPGMDGLEATRQIRSLPGPSGQVPILALTAYVLPVKIAQCHDAGMDGYVAKPVEYATLVSAIDEAVARGRTCRSGSGAPEAGRSPRFDRGRFETALRYLPSHAASMSLELLHARMEEMLRLLHRPTPAAVLMEAAHDLASVAGTFGLAALSAAACSLEHGLAGDAPNPGRLSERTAWETNAALAILGSMMSDRQVPSMRLEAEPSLA